MIKVSIIGNGNLAQHLIEAFCDNPDIELVQVYSRSTELSFPNTISDISKLEPADLYIVAVSDSAIANVAESLPFENRLVVHTSGSVSIEELGNKNRRGVFYPAQTFTKGKAVDFTNIPICIESGNERDRLILQAVANAVSNTVISLDSKQRQALHIAAVFVNNFTNHLYSIAADMCAQNNIPFEILKPLLLETAQKATVIAPMDAQTGPAVRNDKKTLDVHLDYLSGNNRELYQLLTKSIQAHAQKL